MPRSLLDAPLLALVEQARHDRLFVPTLPPAVPAFAAAGIPLAPLLDALAAAEARGFAAERARRSAHTDVLAARAAADQWLDRARTVTAAVRDRLALVEDPTAAATARAVRGALPRDVVGRRLDATARCLDEALPLLPAVVPPALVAEVAAVRANYEEIAARSARARSGRAIAVAEAEAATAALREVLRRLRRAWEVVDAVTPGVPGLPDDALRAAATARRPRRSASEAVTPQEVGVTPLDERVTRLDDGVTKPGKDVTAPDERVTVLDDRVTAQDDRVTGLEVRVTALNASVTRRGGP